MNYSIKSIKDINTFKGVVDESKEYNFFKHCERIGNCFQLTQPFIAGRQFFLFIENYWQLFNKIDKYITNTFKDFIAENGSGDKYIRNPFYQCSNVFADRFNIDTLKSYIEILYKWAYSIRIVKKAVYLESINSYAQGKNDLNYNCNLFEKISEMKAPQELENVVLEKIEERIEEKKINENYRSLYENYFIDKYR